MKTWIKAIFLTILVSCGSVDKKTQFDMDFTSEVVIESSVGVNLPFNVYSPDVETDSESEFEVNNTKKGLIEEILLTSLALEIKSPSGADFSFLESIQVFLSADGLAETRVAWNENVSANSGSKITLDVSSDDLKEYIKKDVINLRVNTTTDEVIMSDHHIEVQASFFVDAKIFGQ